MVEHFEHLRLPFISEELFRKKSPGKRGSGFQKTERDKDEFYKTEIQHFSALKENFASQKRKFKDFFDPKLIYKIEIDQNVDENILREELKKFDIEVIAPSPGKKGFWVVFSEDTELKKFEDALLAYTKTDKKYGTVLDAVKDIVDIPPEEKIGPLLKERPLGPDEVTPLDFSVWNMDNEQLASFLTGFKNFIKTNGSYVLDEFKTKHFCRLKIRVNSSLLQEILQLKEIESVDRPPRIRIQETIQADIRDHHPEGKPTEDAPGILVIDSGILPSHPLLVDSVGDAISIATRDQTRVRSDDPYDELGHGTQVAGIALYGDIQECIDNNKFVPEFWIFSSKVMYPDENGNPTYDPDELIEHQLYSAVTRIIEQYPQCRIINLSLGSLDDRMSSGKRQFNIASLIDELALKYQVIFVVCAGNNFECYDHNDYPEYLLDETTDLMKIIDTASSALGITVGALYNEAIPGPLFTRYILQPSHNTRVGPGYRGMIKPELVEIGGSISNDTYIPTIHFNWISDHRLFTLDFGTSLSAPKVAHFLAKIMKKFPLYSNNSVKALLMSSASIPEVRPGSLGESDFFGNATNQRNLLNVYGYGQPNIEKAFYSERNRVLLIRENKIKNNHVHIYPFFVPSEFINIKGMRKISVALAFDPVTNKNRVDYLGVNIEIHLLKNVDPNSVKQEFGEMNYESNDEEQIPESLKKREIKLYPGSNIRKKGVHQKGVAQFIKKPDIDPDIPLTLVIVCKNRWVEKNYEQEYSVIATVEHSENIDLYNQIRIKNRARAEITL